MSLAGALTSTLWPQGEFTNPALKLMMNAPASSESTAGNFRPSTTNSLQRLRATAPHLPFVKGDADVPPSQPHDSGLFDIGSLLRQALFPGSLLPVSNRYPHSRPWIKLCFKWMLLTYCFLSFVVFSVDLYIDAPPKGVDNLNSSTLHLKD